MARGLALLLLLLLVSAVTADPEGSGSSAPWDGDEDANSMPEEAARAQEDWLLQADQPLVEDDGPEDTGAEPPEGAVSLAFVFDSTGSMWDDLLQVRAGAERIMAAMLEEPDSPVYNYVLVPFKDPAVGPVTVTRSHGRFRQSLQDIRVNGGGDCAETSIAAVAAALEASLPRSFVFVFTDARSKDYRLVPAVLALVQRKQTQVVFVLTGYCHDLTHEGYLAYEKIAATSLGQVFHIKKQNVEEILEFARHSLSSRRVNLLSASGLANQTTRHRLQVDGSLSEFMVSVSGRKPSLAVTDPRGSAVLAPPLVDLENVRVVSVKQPGPGPWTLRVASHTDHVVRSTGVSAVDFVTGFAVAPTVDPDQASRRPLKGANSSVLTRATESGRVHNLTAMKLVGLDNRVLAEIALQRAPGRQEVYVGGPVFPPYEFFYIEVNGFDKEGYPIKRLSPTAITSQDPAPPVVTIQPRTAGWIGDPAVLKCHVESLVPFKVMWFKDGSPVSGFITYQQTSKVTWGVPSVSQAAEGNYTCWARNSAGVHKGATFLSVSGPPPEVRTADQVMASPGSSAALHCEARSLLPHHVTWARANHSSRPSADDLEAIKSDERVSVLDNGTLIVDSVTTEDEGWYVCISENKGGRDEGSVFLAVREPLTVTVAPESFTFTQDENITISCTASGVPKPKVTWMKNGSRIVDLPNSRIKLVEDQENGINIVIGSARSFDEGLYQCEAENDLETVGGSSSARYVEAPVLTAEEGRVLAKVGDKVTLRCRATGVPRPTVTWARLQADPRREAESQAAALDGSLQLVDARLSDAGTWVCRGRNEAGSHEASVALDVGTPPEVLQPPVDVEVRFGGSGVVPCVAVGSPRPAVSWRREDGAPLDEARFSAGEGGLHVAGAVIDDQGTYVCTVENILGTVQMSARLNITGFSAPVLDAAAGPSLTLLRGQAARLPCRALLGEPPPALSWLKDGQPLRAGRWPGLGLAPDGSLLVLHAAPQLQGSYSCVATSPAGSAARTTQLRVLEPPRFQAHADFQGPVHKMAAGESTRLPCHVRGQPKPSVTWEKDGAPLPPSATVFKNHSDDSLMIINATEATSGTYTCIAANSAGAENKSFAVFVQVPAKIATSSSDLTTIEGGRVNMYCVIEAVPAATVLWYKNNHSLSEDQYEMVMMDGTAKLSFVANFSDNGVFKCVAANEVGTDETEIPLNVVVPPSIYPPDDQFLKVNAGESVALDCQAHGYPTPTVSWQKNGAPITNATNVSVTADFTLRVGDVRPSAAGVYVCDAESPAGISQKTFYLVVHVLPKIHEDLPNYIQLKEGEDYALPCSAEGIPTPSVTWRKDDIDVTSNQFENLTVLEDSTLIITSASPSTTGLYTCVAENIDGEDTKHFIVEVMVPPSTTNPQVTRLEVISGDSVLMTCPDVEAVPPPTFTWLKEGGPALGVRDAGRTLLVREAAPADGGGYACVVRNQAGRAQASFSLEVLSPPRLEPAPGGEDRPGSVLEGSPLVLRCPVVGNPAPVVSWRKNDVPVTAHTAPGTLLSSDGQVLTVPRARPHNSGRYRCVAANKVGHASRDFLVSVIVPPHLDGPTNEIHEVLEGEPILLQCPIAGVPEPAISWSRDGRSLKLNEDQELIVSDDKRILELSTTEKYDEGMYRCMGTNAAGSQTKMFNITVLEAPQIQQEHFIEELEVREGGGAELACRVSGVPAPQVVWLHNGRVAGPGEGDAGDSRRHLLRLGPVGASAGGKYTCLASNRVGVAEKNFRVAVLLSPRMLEGADSAGGTAVESLEGLPVTLTCPVVGGTGMQVRWTRDGRPLNEEAQGSTLVIEAARVQHSGNYTCMAGDAGDRVSQTFLLDVMAPPAVADEQRETDLVVRAGRELRLHCNATGHPPPDVLWLKGAAPVAEREGLGAALQDHGRTLVIPSASMHHSGQYSCLANNKAGTSEMTFYVEVQEPPHLDDSPLDLNHTVKLHRRLMLRCPLTGSPAPKITWFKDGVAVLADGGSSSLHVSSDGRQLHLMQARATDAGEYSCLAENSAGSDEAFFDVRVQVPAEWSAWSPWSDCSATCGPGERLRVRECGEQGGPDPSRDPCPGDAQQTQACFMSVCQVDGGWSDWTEWTSCSVSCGRGTRRRYRKCDRPEPAYGGRPCLGSDGQQEACARNPCPVHGGWSGWSAWSECSASCDEGSRYRTRACSSPSPAYNGSRCVGADMESDSCHVRRCPVDGSWSQWVRWTACSAECGSGFRRRYRSCAQPEPQFGGAPCSGDNLQIEKCEGTSCGRAPLAAELRVRGRLNGHDMGDSVIAARVQDRGHQRLVTAAAPEVLQLKAQWFPYVPFVLSPVLWSTAKEEQDASNGYSLTRGNFRQDSLMEFVGGEELRVTHTGRGLDEYGTLRVDIEVNGAVPFVQPEASVTIKPYEEDYIQTGPNTLFATSTNALSVDGKELPYSWNNTVHYDSLQGTMPYLVEKLSAANIGLQFDRERQEVRVSASSSISRKFDQDKCPEGFALNEKFMHCADVNECRDKLANGCHYTQQCENLFGSYRCYCRPGFSSLGAGKRCQDVDECAQHPPVCAHICRNKKGGYKCSCYPGFVLQFDGKTCSSAAAGPTWKRANSSSLQGWGCPRGHRLVGGVCADVDECVDAANACGPEQTCLNSRGGFTCLDTPCPPHYERDGESGRHCVQFCDEDGADCATGARLMETVIHTALAPGAVRPYQDLMVLAVHGEDGLKLARTRFHVVENEIGKPFRVRFENGQGILYTLRYLKPEIIHRVSILASSYDEGERSILYSTTFVVFILLPEE
ncbi:hemicentin-1-like [Bacillus rossius redtenbacheri]|uniref:hemicentin-1-like n=1 Tax=Bacillus rossius redtenbacheri TaxID=93214 RepID=UPI002FDEF771